MKKLKKPLSILLSLIMIFSLFTIVPFTANAAQGVYYKYVEWDELNHHLLTVYTFCSDYTVLDSNSTTLTDGWYLVKNSLDLSRSRIKIEGDVHLILGDGATGCRSQATFRQSIHIAEKICPRTPGQVSRNLPLRNL